MASSLIPQDAFSLPGMEEFFSSQPARQNVAPVPPGGPSFAWPQLTAKFGDKASTPLNLVSLDVALEVHESIPTVYECVFNMVFYNPHNKVLDGSLVFHLPDGAVITGFGLDVPIGGEVVDGVVVEKEKARVAFETEVRAGVDPGLIEAVEDTSNAFRTRVYPLPACGQRKVRVKWRSSGAQVEMTAGAIVHRFPLQPPPSLKHLSFTARVMRGLEGMGKPRLIDTKAFGPSLQFREERGAYVASAISSQPSRSSDWSVTLQLPTGPTPQFKLVQERVEEKDVQLLWPGEPQGSVCHFVVADATAEKLDKQISLQGSTERRQAQRMKITIFWDASMSHGQIPPEAREREITLCEKVVSRMAIGSVVRLIPFRHKPDAAVIMQVKPSANGSSHCPELSSALRAMWYDGATGLSELNMNAAAGEWDIFLLVSDGISTYGSIKGIGALAPEVPTFSVTAATQCNSIMLKSLAESTGGAHLSLATTTIAEASDLIVNRRPTLSLMKVEYKDGEVEDVFPSHGVVLSGTRQVVTVAGRLIASSTTIILRYGIDGRVVSSVSVQLNSRETVQDIGMAERMWADLKIEELEMDKSKNRKTLIELGQRYSRVTPNTSLLVLESLSQHLKHKVPPAKTRAAMYRAYKQAIEEEQTNEGQVERNKLETSVRAMWRQRVDWYDESMGAGVPSSSRASYGSDGYGGWGDGGAEDLLSDSFGFGAQSMGGFDFLSEAPQQPQQQQQQQQQQQYLSRQGYGAMPAMAPPSMSARVSSADDLFGDFDEAQAASSHTSHAHARRRKAKAAPMSLAPSSFAFGSDQASASGAQGASDAQGGPSVVLKGWNPQTPYLTAMKRAGTLPGAYKAYQEARPANMKSPSFFFDCSSWFLSNSDPRAQEIGLRILSNIMELELSQPQLLRIVGYKLTELGELNAAIDVFDKVLQLRPEEPQSYRDLALLLERRGGKEDLSRATELMCKVVVGKWDHRFYEIELTSLTELNRMIAMKTSSASPEEALQQFKSLITPSAQKALPPATFIKNLPMDLRISLAWDTDMTDVDLHVVDPTGEEVYYGHKRSRIGGTISRDFTNGYGPEEFLLRKAIPGKYTIKAKYFASHQQSLTGATTLLITIFKFFGQPGKEERILTSLRLSSNKQMMEVASVNFSQQEIAAASSALPPPKVPQNTAPVLGVAPVGVGNRQTGSVVIGQAAVGRDAVVHHGVSCDSCMRQVVGIRWKCAACTNVDFCTACVDRDATDPQQLRASGHKQDHMLLRILDSSKVRSVPACCNLESWRHVGHSCMSCGQSPILGFRYMCTKTGRSLCHRCEFLGLYDVTIPRLRIAVPTNSR